MASLRQRRDFLWLQTYGRRLRGSLLILLFGQAPRRPESGSIRVGLTVSGRVGNAVVRNRLRRRLRSIVAQSSTLLRPACDHVVVALPRARAANFAALETELQCLLRRSGRRAGP